MADLKTTVDIIFKATDATGSAITSVGDGISSLSTNAQKAAQPLSDLADTMLLAEGAVLAVGAAIATKGLIEFSKYKDATLELQKVLKGDDSLDNYAKDIDFLSDRFAIAKPEIIGALAGFVQAGYQGKDAADALTQALNLAVAGDLSLAQATETLLQTMAGYNAEIDQAPRFLEALNNVSNEYKTNLEELTKATGRAAPIANALGFSFEELVGISTPLVETFRRGEIAGTALASGLGKIIDDAKPVVTTLDQLNVSQFDVNGQMRSGRDIFFDFGDALQSVDKNQQQFYINQVFGLETGAKLATLFSQWDRYTAIYDTSMVKSGSVTKEVETRLDSFGILAERVAISVNNSFATLGGQIADGAGAGLKGLNELIKAFQDVIAHDPALQAFFDFLSGELEDLGKFLSEVATALPDAFKLVNFDALTQSLTLLKESFIGIFDGLDFTKPEDLGKAIQAVIDTLATLNTNTAGVVDAFAPFLQALASGGDAYNALDEDTKLLIGNLQGLGKLVTTLGPIVDTFGGSITALGSAFLAVSTVKSLAQLTEFGGAVGKVTGLLGKTGLAGAVLVASYAITTELLDAFKKWFGIDVSGWLASVTYELLNTQTGAERAAEYISNFSLELENLPDGVTVTVGTDILDDSKFVDLQTKVNEFADKVYYPEVGVTVTQEDRDNLAQAQQELIDYAKQYVANAIIQIENSDQIQEVERQISSLERGIIFNVYPDVAEAEAKLKALQIQLEALKQGVTTDVIIRQQNEQAIIDTEARIRWLQENKHEFSVDVQNWAEQEIVNLQADLEDLKKGADVPVNVQVNSGDIQGQIDQSTGGGYSITANIDLPDFANSESLLEDYGTAWDNLDFRIQGAGKVLKDASGIIQGTSNVFTDGKTAVKDYTIELVNGIPVYTQTAESIDTVTNAVSKTSTESEKAKDRMAKLEETLLTLASNERIKNMEFNANINIANIEAQAKVAVAIIEGVASAIQSADDLIAALFSQDAPDWDRYGFQTQRQIEEANKRAEEGLKLQEKLVNAQVKLMDAQAASLNRGDSTIKIEAEGLDADIEAFMFEILKRIRIKASADYASFLLGV